MAKGKGKKYEFVVSFGGKVDSSLAAAINGVQGKFNSLQSLAKRAAVGVGAAFAAVKVKDFVGDSINTYKSYEQSMAQTAATAGIQKESAEYERLNEAARAAGKATSKTAAEAADALGYMALAGWNVNQSTAALMPVLRLSEGTQADLATTSDLVTDSMSALGIKMDSEGKNLTRYLDVIAAANNKSNQTAMQAMEAYISVGGTFESLNTPIEESAALLGVLANRGTKASEAGTSMNSILINLKKKSGESAKAMKTLGLNAYDSQGKFKGVTNVLKELDAKLKSLSTDEERDMYKDMIAGKTQVDTLNKLLQGLNTFTDDGVTELEALQKQLENSDGALNAMADTVSNTMGMAFARLSSATDDFKIEFISHFESGITPVIDGLANKITAITPKMGAVAERIKGKVLSIKTTITEVKAAFMTLTGKDTSDMGVIFNQEGAKNALSRITGLTTSRIESFIEIYSKTKEATAALLTLAGKNTSALGIQFNKEGAKSALSRITGMTETQLDSLAGTFQKTKQDFLATVDFIKKSIGGIVDTVGKVVSFTISHLDTIAPFAIGIVKVFTKLFIMGKISGVILKVGNTTNKVLTTVGKFGDKIEKVTKAAKKSKMLSSIFSKVAPAAAKIGPTIAKIGPAIAKIGSIAAKGLPLIKAGFAALAGPVGIAIAVVTALVSVGVLLYKNWDTIKQKASEIWTNVKTSFSNMATALSTKAAEIAANVKNGFDNMKNAVVSKALEIWTGVKTTFINMKNSVVSTVTELWNQATTIFGNIKSSIITKATELWEGIKSIFGNIRDSIANAFTGAVNTAIGGLNTLINKVNSVHINIPDWIPGVGGKEIGLNIPQVPTASSKVPALASGGIVTKPTLAMIGEGNESEAVFPLSKLEEFLNNYGTGSTNNNGMVFQIEYKPQIIIQGNGNKEEIQQEVEKGAAKAQADFETQMNQWLKEQKRRGFA